MVQSEDWCDRAEAAIIVCAQSRFALNARFEEIKSP
jgi:hypothetical protein